MYLIGQVTDPSKPGLSDWVDIGDKAMRWGIPATVCLVLLFGLVLLFWYGIPAAWKYFKERDERKQEIELKERENRIRVMTHRPISQH